MMMTTYDQNAKQTDKKKSGGASAAFSKIGANVSARETVKYISLGPLHLHLYWWPERQVFLLDLDWRYKTLVTIRVSR